MNGKDFLSIRDFSPSEIQYLLILAVKSRLIRPLTAQRSGVRLWR